MKLTITLHDRPVDHRCAWYEFLQGGVLAIHNEAGDSDFYAPGEWTHAKAEQPPGKPRSNEAGFC